MTNKYKGMRDYGVSVQDIKDYAVEKGLDSVQVWRKVIDKFVGNGAKEYEGYSSDASQDYEGDGDWCCSEYVTVDGGNDTYHTRCAPETLITVKDLLGDCDDMVEEGVTDNPCSLNPISLPITVHISPQDVIKFLSDNHTMTFSFKRLNEGSDKWKGFDGFSGDGVHLVQIYFKEGELK